MSTGLPSSSSRVYPNSRSVWTFTSTIVLEWSTTTIASGIASMRARNSSSTPAETSGIRVMRRAGSAARPDGTIGARAACPSAQALGLLRSADLASR
jgi:hypothetical protein